MYLVIQPSGVKSWAVRYRGKPRKYTLGTYPKLGLLQSRGAAREVFQAVAHGRDPGTEKLEERRKAREGGQDQHLVSGAVDSFLKRHVRANLSPSTARSTEHLFTKHVLPRWRHRRLDSIKRDDVIALLDAIVDAGSPVAANRVLAAIRKFLNWSIDRGAIEVSPCARVKAPTEEVSRDRVLSDAELRLAWLAADEFGVPFGPIVQLLQRPGLHEFPSPLSLISYQCIRHYGTAGSRGGWCVSIRTLRITSPEPHRVCSPAALRQTRTAIPRPAC
jgi:hypothetical protein